MDLVLRTGDARHAVATLHRLGGAALGPEAVLFIEHRYEAYPLDVPSN